MIVAIHNYPKLLADNKDNLIIQYDFLIEYLFRCISKYYQIHTKNNSRFIETVIENKTNISDIITEQLYLKVPNCILRI